MNILVVLIIIDTVAQFIVCHSCVIFVHTLILKTS